MRNKVDALIEICGAERHPIEDVLEDEDFFAFCYLNGEVVFTPRISSIDFDKKLIVCGTQEYDYSRRSS